MHANSITLLFKYLLVMFFDEVEVKEVVEWVMILCLVYFSYCVWLLVVLWMNKGVMLCGYLVIMVHIL
jgi:hypothetical protein